MDKPVDLRGHRAFSELPNAIALSGFSGAVIGLIKTPSGNRIVRKAAVDAQNSAALRAQSERQRQLRQRLDGAARVPEVLDEGEIDGLYYFDMEYVPSRDAVALLASASFPELSEFAGSVERLLSELPARSVDGSPILAALQIRIKLEEIDQRTHREHAVLLQPLMKAVSRFEAIAESLRPTVVHGDLTFENLLVSARRELWLIDPIASPFDHYWFDWAKLFQESEGLWHRHRGRPISIGVVRWLRDRWLATATRLDESYAAWHNILLGLTFARILPYAKSASDIAFVSARVTAFGLAATEQLESGS